MELPTRCVSNVMTNNDFSSQYMLLMKTIRLAMSASQTDGNQQGKKSIILLQQLKKDMDLCISLSDTNKHTYRQKHRLKNMHALDAQRAYTRFSLGKHQARGAADTMECLSMQQTLCLGGRGALKESAEGHPTSL